MSASKLARTLALLHKLKLSPRIVSFMDCELRGSLFDSFVYAVQAALGERVAVDTTRASTLELLGERLTARAWYPIAWRLAGNYSRLALGHPVAPWSRQTQDEWIVLEIEEVERVRTAKGRVAYQLKCLAMTGTCCPMRIETRWQHTFFHKFAVTQLGFSRKQPFRYPHRHWSDMTQMRFEGLLTPELCTASPMFEKIREAPALLKHNRQIISMRERRRFVCPSGYTHPCINCPIGVDRCAAATHPRTYIRRKCSDCEHEAWCDPRHRGLCVECRRKRVDEHS